MKRVVFTILAITVVLSVSAQNMISDKELVVDGQVFNIEDYVFRQGYQGVIKANWWYLIENPKLSGDWQTVYKTENGFAMQCANSCYEFGPSIGLRQFECKGLPDNWKIVNCADFDEDGMSCNKPCGYVYVSRNGRQHVIVYGR